MSSQNCWIILKRIIKVSTLIFILTLLFSIFSAFSTIYFLLRKKRQKTKTSLFRFLTIIFCYGILLLIFSLTSQNKVLPLNQDKCFDEWCVSIIKIEKQISERQNLYVVTVRISNMGKGRAQKPDHPQIYVMDDLGNKYMENETAKSDYEKQFGSQRTITSQIDAQTSFETSLVFVLPQDRSGNIVITEGGFPTLLIIGDEGSFLHRKSMTPLE